MTRVRSFSLSLLFLLVASFSASAQSLWKDAAWGRGSREHPFDVLHIDIDVKIYHSRGRIAGTVTHRLRSLAQNLSEITLDCDSTMSFSRVAVDGQSVKWKHEGEKLTIAMTRPLRFDDTASVAIDYEVAPRRGMYFRYSDTSGRGLHDQVWTQGEDEDNHFWLPMYDNPNDQATSEVRATVRGDWKVLSNGVLLDTRKNSDGTSTWHWRLDQPHAGYLIMIAAGNYLVTRDTVDGIPLEYWTYPESPERVVSTFQNTPDIIRFFNKLIGVRYPWPKYAQVMLEDFMYGGMENTSATTLNDYSLVDWRGRVEYNPDGLIAHEAAHQWFGDLITNRSWDHLWLHESYATYLASRYTLYKYGSDAFAKEMYDAGQSGIKSDQTAGRNPVSGGQGFTSNVYDRGSRILHMLNSLVGEENFWRAHRLFLERHKHGLVETRDLQIAFEDATGQNLSWFFDEWITGAGYPVYKVSWTNSGDAVKLRVQQQQDRDSLTGLFRMPIPVEVYLDGNVVRDTLLVSSADSTYSIAAKGKPRYVIFDAGDAILKEVDFQRPASELIAQLDAPRMIDRFLAVKALTTAVDPSEQSQISSALTRRFSVESASQVRELIVQEADVLNRDDAERIVSAGLADSVVWVRRAAVDRVESVRDTKRRAELLRPLLRDTSISVTARALRSLARIDTTGLLPTLRALRGVRGRRGNLANAWLEAAAAMRAPELMSDVLSYTARRFGADTRGRAFETLEKIPGNTQAVEDAIVAGLTDPSPTVRLAASRAARAHMTSELRRRLEGMTSKLNGDSRSTVEQVLRQSEGKPGDERRLQN